jgi:predicted transcriptional regulator
MTKNVITIPSSCDVSQAAQTLVRESIHNLVVVDAGMAVGSFGSVEIYRAVGDMRPSGLLQDIMTNVIFEIDCHETLRAGLRFLENAGVRGLVVRDGDRPVGIFGQHEALAAASQPLDTPVDLLMSSRFVCLSESTPCFRAAQQAGALGLDQIIVTSEGDSCGLASATDFVPLLVEHSESLAGAVDMGGDTRAD